MDSLSILMLMLGKVKVDGVNSCGFTF